VKTEQVIRDKTTGLCIACKPGEVGELLGFIDETDALREFSGYTDKRATEKKILKDVFVKGDKYFRTGDLLKMDKVRNILN
jgi:acyl-CoA synthetase (AMP-forming)/AMP-acid ligase II